MNRALFAAFLTLFSVSITNSSSFLLGGITEDLADMISLQTLMNYSLSDIPDKAEREKSLKLVKNLFTLLLLHKEISRSNIVSAVVRGTTSFLASILPIITYFTLQIPLNIVASLGIVGAVVAFSLFATVPGDRRCTGR